jgi:formate dehydrogenase major subunit
MGGKFTRGKGLFTALTYTPPAECPDEEYPMWLSTGRRLWHYHTGTQTHNSVGMDSLCGEEWLEMNPVDAIKMDIKTGDIVRASSRRGEITLKAWVTDRSPVDLCWTSFHFAEACANELTNDAFDTITNTAEYKACAIRVEKVADGEPMGNPLVPSRQARP